MGTILYIKKWNLKNRRLIKSYPIRLMYDNKQKKPIYYEIEVEMVMTPNNRYLYIGGYSVLKKLDAVTLKLVEETKTNDLYINQLAMSPDGSYLYIGSLFRDVMKLNLLNNQLEKLKGCKF